MISVGDNGAVFGFCKQYVKKTVIIGLYFKCKLYIRVEIVENAYYGLYTIAGDCCNDVIHMAFKKGDVEIYWW